MGAGAPAPARDELEETLLASVPYAEVKTVDLGVTRFLLRTNVPGFSGFRYFSRLSPGVRHAPYELSCIDLAYPHSLHEEAVRAQSDSSFRGKRFRAGFYLTCHCGAPALLITRDRRHYVVGRGLDRMLWGWYTKYVLTVHSLQNNSLHLKAACLGYDGEGTLLIGKGGGGKTVFLTQMCQEDADFVSNTHVIVDQRQVGYGVPTTLRVRNDPCFGAFIRSGRLKAHLDEDEFIADPTALFARSAASVKIRNICVLDYNPGRQSGIQPLTSDAAYDIFEQFGFPINTYGMKDDILQFFGGDVAQFVDAYASMKRHLRKLVESSSCFYVNCDMMDPDQRARVRRVLTGRMTAQSHS